MAMVCPQCHGSFAQHLQCPSCGVPLLCQADLKSAVVPRDDEEGQWQQTPWGRMIVGLVLAQGLSHGLQLLITAGFLAGADEDGRSVWATLFGLLLMQGIQGIGLLVGGAITGAGQAKGLFFAALVGLINGLIFLFVQRNANEAMPAVALYGQPLIHMVFGGLGGLIGTSIWKPLPTIRIPELEEPKAKRRHVGGPGFLDGRIHWARVAVGTALVIGGVVWSHRILDFVLEASQGKLTIKTHLQAQLVGWEISAVAALLGAALAGATTTNGLKQGLCVGVTASILLVGIHLSNPNIVLETTVFTVASILCLTLAGGWFGGQLFPPILARRRNRFTMV